MNYYIIIIIIYRKVLEKRPSQPAPKQYLDDPVIISLGEFFREGEHDLKDEVKEITRLEFKHDLSKQQLFNVLIPSLFDESYNVEKLTARKALFLAVCLYAQYLLNNNNNNIIIYIYIYIFFFF